MEREKGSRVLLVEDEENLAKGLEYNLTEEGYAVSRAADGRKALELFETQEFDLVILDIMLPHIDGFEVAERIKIRAPRLPILILTAMTSLSDKVRGFETGVDDYLTKPFHLEELILRVKGILKRTAWYEKVESLEALEFGVNRMDFASLTAYAGKRQIQLTPLEADLLKYLAERPDRIVSRQELLEHVWHASSEIESRTVDNFIVRLRKYFEPDPSNPRYIVNIRGAGYRFIPDGEE